MLLWDLSDFICVAELFEICLLLVLKFFSFCCFRIIGLVL